MEDLHVVVGIDFGYTHTGVAFAALQKGILMEPLVIQTWPGKKNEVVNKVPTRLAYKAGQEGCTSWGFKVKRKSTRGTEVAEYFKLLLDRNLLRAKSDRDSAVHIDSSDDGESDSEEESDEPGLPPYSKVQKWFVDFLSKLYQWIQTSLAERYQAFRRPETIVEYIFSVPTTWDPDTVAEFYRIITGSGYGSVDGHTAKIGLTEAEAAAAFSATYDSRSQRNAARDPVNKLQVGDVILVCDAGGGTTDVSMLRVSTMQKNVPQLDELAPVQGWPVGSVLIDEDFEEIAKERLSKVKKLKKRSERAKEMTTGEFQNVKIHFGDNSTQYLSTFSIKVPGMDPSESYDKARIRNGMMEFTKPEIKDLFDKRIQKIMELVDNQLFTLMGSHSSDRVHYIVLSGGLGSSEYLRQYLEDHYPIGNSFSNVKGAKILVANDPQLVVCRGLVLQRIQESFKISIIRGRCCRASYGVLYQEPWIQGIHSKKERHKNPYDDEWYVDRIHWLISKNEMVKDDEPPLKTFTTAVPYKEKAEKWVRHWIVSYDKIKDRPNTHSENTPVVCALNCDLRPAILAQDRRLQPDTTEKDRKKVFGAKLGSRLLRVKYDISVHVGPADLKFKLKFANELQAQNKDTINVDWTPDMRMMAEPRTGDSDGDEDD